MTKYVIKRLLLAVVTVFIILSLTFILIKLLPFTMPIGTIETQHSYFLDQVGLGYVTLTYSESSSLGELLFKYTESSGRTEYFYQTPIMIQYGNWLKNIFTAWNWGTSVKLEPNIEAIVIIGNRIPVSMSINFLSLLFSVPIGIVLGIIAALNKNKAADNIISTLVMVFISIPSFVLITFLLYILAYKGHLLPTQWPNPSEPANIKALGYVLPVFVLSFASICSYTRFTRAELCEVMESEYLLLARTKGLTKQQAIIRHALKNAMVPIIPLILLEFIGILGGSMVLEQLYGIPGIGTLFVNAINAADYNVLFVDMAVFTTVTLVASVFVDLSYGLIDPRIRMGAKKK